MKYSLLQFIIFLVIGTSFQVCIVYRCYGLPTDPLPLLLQEMAEHYTEVLMQRWVAVFRDILDNASFLPIEVCRRQFPYHHGMHTIFPIIIIVKYIP